MRIERRILPKPTNPEAGKQAALARAQALYPGCEVRIHAFYDGDFYVSVKRPGESFARVGAIE